MDFGFSEEQRAFRLSVREWVNRNYPKSKVNAIERLEDHDGTNFPHEYFNDLGSAGFFGIGLDEEYGGQGGGLVTQCILMEELARNLAGFDLGRGVTTFCAKSIARFGQPALLKSIVPEIADGKVKVSISVTEPGGGTDLLGGMKTTATQVDGGWVINGSKIWSTMAHVADYLLLLAKSSDESRSSGGKTLFLVPAKQAGVVAKPIPKLGMRCLASCEVFLDDAFVPDENVIGEVGGGWGHLIATLNAERVLVAALCTGVLSGVIEDAVRYANDRHAFGHAIGEFQAIQHTIAEMVIKHAQSQLMTYKAAWLYDEGLPSGIESSMAKSVAAEYSAWAADRGIQILGGMGYSAEMDMQRYWRDVRLYEIGPISNEMVRNMVTQSVGLPRSF